MDAWTQDAPMPRIDAIEASQRTFLQRVFGWMAGGLGITAALAIWVSQPEVFASIYGRMGKGLFFGLLIGELLLVFAISGAVSKMKTGLATGLFLLYSALNGLTIGPILMLYTEASVNAAFLASAVTFGACAAYGYFTKTDLSKFGGIMAMVLIGLIVATVVNLFLKSTGLSLVLTYVGVFVFIGLTAYDTQKLKDYHRNGVEGGQADRSMAIGGALTLYLDFINLFLLLLRLMGQRKN